MHNEYIDRLFINLANPVYFLHRETQSKTDMSSESVDWKKKYGLCLWTRILASNSC